MPVARSRCWASRVNWVTAATVHASRTALRADGAQIGVEVAERRAVGLAQARAIREQSPSVVEIVGAPERERRLDGAVLEVPGGERAVCERAADDLLVPLVCGSDVL